MHEDRRPLTELPESTSSALDQCERSLRRLEILAGTAAPNLLVATWPNIYSIVVLDMSLCYHNGTLYPRNVVESQVQARPCGVYSINVIFPGAYVLYDIHRNLLTSSSGFVLQFSQERPGSTRK